MSESIINLGIGLQAIITTLIMLGINKIFKVYAEKVPLLQNKALTQMLQVYALICIIIALVSINDIPRNLLSLTR